jgi:predicted phage tail protein
MQHNIYGQGGGGKGGGGSSRVAVESPNDLQSKAILRVVELVSEGEIEGLLGGAKSIYLDDTPLQNEDDSYNFEGVNYEERVGTPDQDVISGFPSAETEVSVGTQVVQSTPVVRTVTDSDLDAIRVTMRIPALTYQDPKTGDLRGSEVQYIIEYQPDGGSYITAHSDIVRGKTTTPYERAYRVNLTGSAPMDRDWETRKSPVFGS